MVKVFKNKSQRAHFVSILLLIGHWNYCAQNAQYSNTLTQDIATSLKQFRILIVLVVCIVRGC